MPTVMTRGLPGVSCSFGDGTQNPGRAETIVSMSMRLGPDSLCSGQGPAVTTLALIPNGLVLRVTVILGELGLELGLGLGPCRSRFRIGLPRGYPGTVRAWFVHDQGE